MDKKLEWVKFIAKYLAILISAVWILIAGTDLIYKKSAALDLRNKKLGIESIPLAKPSLTYNFDNEPWIGEGDLCTITGQYSVENVGKLPIMITEVVFNVYEKSVINSDDIGESRIMSFTLSSALRDLEPMIIEVIPEFSKIDVGQSIERSFGFVIKRLPGKLYAVTANAKGGLLKVSGGVDEKNQFGQNELRVNTGFRYVCGGDETIP